MPSSDHFQTLGLTSGATQEQVKQSYRALLLQHHPDKQPRRRDDSRTPTPNPPGLKIVAGSEESETQEDRVIALTEAYRVLSDPEFRAEYELADGFLILYPRSVLERSGSVKNGKNGSMGIDAPTRHRQRNPTRVISLEEWTYHPATVNTGSAQARNGHANGHPYGNMNGHSHTTEDTNGAYYTHPCRCSGTFVISESQLEEGVDIVGCEGCGEWVGVGYEMVEDGYHEELEEGEQGGVQGAEADDGR
ncbi:hypothetical protein QFC21_002510 [Naganishia friedmannii]|uniref:Uncharacterized protein n=1 Tax=Naganishia friedmannii TaxID=89922 RepID=A0ACC2VUK2_9TREE|nr:hypothetical protein QFC21_002510 [Naganishia friedmannii]